MNFCTECGNKLAGGERFCPQCGHTIATDVSGAEDRAPADFQQESTEQPRSRDSGPPPLPGQAHGSAKTGVRGSKVVKVLKTFVLSLIAPAVVLTPGLLLHLGSYHIESTAWMLISTVLVFAFQYRKSWHVNWTSTLIPAAALLFVFLVMRHLLADVRAPFRGELLIISLWGALLGGLAIGLVWGARKSLGARNGIVLTSGLVVPILAWGLIHSILVMSLTIVGVPAIVPFVSFVVWLFSTGSLFTIYLTLFFRRYLFTGGWIGSPTVFIVVLLCLLSSSAPAFAQGFSESDTRRFLDQEIPSVMEQMGEWFKQQNWPAEPAGIPGALNHNSPRMDVPNALGYQFSVRMAYRPGETGGATTTIRALLLKYRSEKEAGVAAQANVDDIKSKYSSGGKLHNVRVERVEISPDSVRVAGNWNLPSGRTTEQFTIVYSYGPYAVRMEEARSASESTLRRHLALAKAVKYALEQRGVRGSGGISSRNGPTKQGGRLLSGDAVSGRSIGGGFLPGLYDSYARGNSRSYGRPKNYQGSHLPDREVTQATGIVSILILGSTVLTAVGSMLFGGLASGIRP